MNPESYFEDDPWSYTTTLVTTGELGRIKAVAIQATVPEGWLESAREMWEGRLIVLFGQPEQRDELKAQTAVSVLLRFPDSILARVFLDQGPGEPVAAFEVVADDKLLVWRPDVHRLSRIQSGTQNETACEHAYASALGKETLR